MVNGSPSPSQGGDSNTNSSEKEQDDPISRLEKEIDSLTSLLLSKEREWNAILKLKKLKEISLQHLKRQSEISGILESHPIKTEPVSESTIEETVDEQTLKIGPDESQVQINCIKTEKQISELEIRLKNNSFKTTSVKNSPSEIQLENFEATIALQQLCEKNRTSSCQPNSNSTNNLTVASNKIIGEGRQGPIVEVRSIIADYRSKNPEEALTPSSSRRPSKGVALLKPLLKTRSDISYKDVLVTLAKMSQQDNLKDGPSTVSTTSANSNSTAHITKSDNRAGTSSNSSALNIPTVNPTRGPLATTLAKLLSSNSTVTAASNRSDDSSAHSTNNIQFASNNLPNENTLSLANLLASSKCLDEEVKPDEEEIPLCQGCSSQRAQFVCAGCGNQWYCSRECQVAAWDDHSEQCSS